MAKLYLFFICIGCSFSICAQDINGIWKTIDDKTGNSDGLIEIKKNADNQYTGTIIKSFPTAVGFKAIDICQNCPAPYRNQPILGMQILKDLRYDAKTDRYEHGNILDPRQGKLYKVRAKLSSDHKYLHLRGYIGVSALGRTQVWIRQ
ncbi:MAG: DUF2147 domain-containing protein [Acinetobacter sp.]|jgi:uncharacterized protein (DUF2147 family)